MTKSKINDNWRFMKPGADPVTINIPHTWNNLDGQDGGNNYFRDECIYQRKSTVSFQGEERVYAEFEGANSIAEVLVNGKSLGTHRGGYSTFRFDITDEIESGSEFELEVRVDNRHYEDVYPLMADFTFMGGLYREARLLTVNPLHFDLDDCGSPGIYIHQNSVSRDRAELNVISAVTAPDNREYEVHLRLINADGAVAASGSGKNAALTVEQPHLWQGTEDPYLYTLEADLVSNGVLCDLRRITVGLRSVAVDPDRGFLLNGIPLPLKGVSRHQDRRDMGWALGAKEMEEDIALIREMGSNSIRLAHYQHNQYFYDLCDREGIITWAEIPYISIHSSDDPEGTNALEQMEELVKQNLNHPSIVMWGVQNEITIGGTDEIILTTVTKLNSLTRELDSNRLTAQAQVGHHPDDDPLNSITDLIGYNKYYGWYYDDTSAMGRWLDDFHKTNPSIPLGITEYGCEAILDYHNDDPKMGDYSEEYQTHYHHEILKTFNQRPWIWGTYVWNMFDFASDLRDEGGVQGMNNKGLVTHDRKTRKDSFYIYKSYWSDEDVLHIASRRYSNRVKGKNRIRVITNQEEVELLVNGVSAGSKRVEENTAVFEVKISKGVNSIVALSGNLSDSIVLTGTAKEDPSYICTAASKNPMGEVQNWFAAEKGDEEVPPLEFPEGYFSVKDKISSILKHPEGEPVLRKYMAEMFDHSMFAMIKTFSLDKLAAMSPGTITDAFLYKVNCELNKLEK